MATVNLSRDKGRHKKLEKRVFSTVVDYTGEIGTSGDTYQLLNLPPEVLVTAASIYVITPSDAATTATGDLGFDGDGTLVKAGNLKSAANSNLTAGASTVVPQLKLTGGVLTFKPTYTGATTVGKFRITVEYIEYTMVNGEITNFVA